MLDKDLFFAENQRSAIIPGPGVWGSAPLPDLVFPNYLDLKVVCDLARGNPLFANFRITQAFNNVAGNFLRFAVYVSNDVTFFDVLTNAELTLARSHDIPSLGLVDVGYVVPVALPPYGDLLRVLGEGRRYMALGFDYLVPTTDWSTGLLDAFLSPQALPLRPLSTPSGY